VVTMWLLAAVILLQTWVLVQLQLQLLLLLLV
jgi:hypothetical protein